MTKIKYCKTCGFLDPRQPVCLLRREQVDPTADFCSKYEQAIPYGDCSICGQPVYSTNLVVDILPNGSHRYIHLACAKALNTCATCAQAQSCEFETNPDPMPKVVMQTVRQGNMVMQQQVRNPDRVRKFCENCHCFSPEDGCLKQNNYCNNWKER